MNPLRILPEMVMVLGGILVMMVDAFLPRHSKRESLAGIAWLVSLAALAASVWQLHQAPGAAYFNAIYVDAYSSFFHVLIAVIVLCTLLISPDYFAQKTEHIGEYYALVLLGASGMMFMTSANSLLMVFIGLEISSISTYILSSLRKQNATGPEAGLKYFLLGSFATAFFLYGVALAFGLSGSDNFDVIGTQVSYQIAHGGPLWMAYAALAMMLIGLGFKVSAAPFHVWTPDVYEGAASPVVGLMSTAPKAAAFAVLLRLLNVAFPALELRWSMLLWLLSVASMTVGNLGALLQNNVKRMLAYSSIAHAGYILAAFAVGSDEGIAAASFYLVSYAAMNVGAFAVLSHIAQFDERANTLSDYAGLAKRSPFLAAVFTFFLLSLIGIPLTGGFFGKFYVFTAVLHSGYVWLAVIGLLNSGVASYYYLRVIAAMYMREPDVKAISRIRPLTFGTATVLVFAAAATLFLGIMPGHVVTAAKDGAATLRRTLPVPISPEVTGLVNQEAASPAE